MTRYRVVDAEARAVVEFHADDHAAAVAQAKAFAEADVMQDRRKRRALRLLKDQETAWVVVDVWMAGR